jgi:signal peptide peptidase SppA
MLFANAILRHDPLLIEPRLLTAFVERCSGFSDTVKELFGEPPQARVENGIGIVPVSGILGQGLMPIEKLLGASDTADLSATLDAFAADPDVHALLLDIDSPGGTVTGIPELAAQIAAFPKPTYAFTSSEACSAAYWLGSQATEFLCTQSATVGSVGVYLAVLDASDAFAQRGLFVDLIKAGTYKAAGFPGTSLTDGQRALLQERVDQIHALFKDAVSAKRRYVSASALEGQTFYGMEAAKQNLVTGIVPSRAALLTKLTTSLMQS